MRKKVSTLLEETLYRRVKLEAAVQGKQISEIIGQALKEYLEERRPSPRDRDVVGETWASLELPADEIEAILNEEEDWLDAR